MKFSSCRKALCAVLSFLLLLSSCVPSGHDDGTLIRLELKPRTKELTLGMNAPAELRLAVITVPESVSGLTLDWKSSNPGVAVVNDGLVTAVAVGKTTITASDPLTGKRSHCTVTVFTLPRSVSLDLSELSLETGSSKKLRASLGDVRYIIRRNKTITWSSSDTGVVTVDSMGRVRAVGPGTAVVTAATVNGITASCSVDVS